MFTLEKIAEANSKVKSGADFPRLVQELIGMGIVSSDVYVSDGHAEYFGKDGEKVVAEALYKTLDVSNESLSEEFTRRLKAHQQGQTDYPTFCLDAAETGIEKWTLDLEKMTCAYYDKAGNEILVEQIPTV
ncbi:MAG: DUF1398 domain-containing protein [Pyrinomonadaceae bacterium]|nr:DUF1398 domain-containing protein [Pyrinomonadaceae bacterium]